MRTIATCCAVALLAIPAARAFDQGHDEKAAAADEMPMPKPGPEHELLTKDVGTWDAKVESWTDASKPPIVSSGTEVNRLVGGGMWLVSDFNSERAGQPFDGHGVTGWDPVGKKYVALWVASMSTGLGLGESTWDEATQTVTGMFEMPGPDGKLLKMKSMKKYVSDDQHVLAMSMPAPDGEDLTILRITYTRKK